jgi:hypothetical protein
MGKVPTNSRIGIYFTSLGSLAQHDIWLNQPLTTVDSPTFSNLSISKDTTINGNLFVNGSFSIFKQETFFDNNFIVLNASSGSVTGDSGILIDRGTSANYEFAYQESSKSFRVGIQNSTQSVATREDSPLANGIATWNSVANRFDSLNYSDIDFQFLSTTNASILQTYIPTLHTYLQSGQGALNIPNGGMYIGQDVIIKNNLLLLGGSTSASIFGDSSNSLNFKVLNTLNISSSNLILNSNLSIFDTANASTTLTDASIYTTGGITVSKDLISLNSISAYTNSTSGLSIKTAAGNDILTVNANSLTTSFSSGVVINNNNTAGFNILNGNSEILTTNCLTGQIRIYSTTDSIGISTGSLLIDGGVSIDKNLSVGSQLNLNSNLNISNGNIYLNGQLASLTILSTPTISFINTGNVSSISYGNVKLETILNNTFLTFYIKAIPVNPNANTQFSFVLPNKSVNFTTRLDIISSISGYADENNLTTLFNTLCVANTGGTSALVQFESINNTDAHNLMVYCKYSTP